MSNKKKTLEDIFEDDDLGLLNKKPVTSHQKSEDQRLIDSFEEINSFFEKNEREPASGSISEMKLSSRLKGLRENPTKIEILKDYDRFHLLTTPKKIESLDDIFNDDLDLLKTDETLSIFKLEHVSDPQDRAEADFIARREAIDKEEFEKYEQAFKKVQQQLRSGDRKIIDFKYESLKPGEYYIHNGILLYLESVEWERTRQEFKTGAVHRPDGRTRTIFENGTESRMMFQSLYKSLHENGRMITQPDSTTEEELFKGAHLISEEDQETGWIYILKSKSTNPEISQLNDLYKIGYSKLPVPERIRNATKESTYLHADVQIIATYKCYNLHVQKFENLLHRFFAEVCLNVDIHDPSGRRITPREWFIAPFEIIEEVISLILSGKIINYYYDSKLKNIFKKNNL